MSRRWNGTEGLDDDSGNALSKKMRELLIKQKQQKKQSERQYDGSHYHSIEQTNYVYSSNPASFVRLLRDNRNRLGLRITSCRPLSSVDDPGSQTWMPHTQRMSQHPLSWISNPRWRRTSIFTITHPSDSNNCGIRRRWCSPPTEMLGLLYPRSQGRGDKRIQCRM